MLTGVQISFTGRFAWKLPLNQSINQKNFNMA